MPFITVELPQGVTLSLSCFALWLHNFLAPELGASIDQFKTKLLRPEEAFVGDGSTGMSYARVKIELKAGRSLEVLKKCQTQILSYFSEALKKENPQLFCRITVEFSEIHPELLVAETSTAGS